MMRSPSSASRATRASTDARSLSDIALWSRTASGAPFTATQRADRVSPHCALAPAHRIERVAGESLARRGLGGGLAQRAIDRVLSGRGTVCGRGRSEHVFAVAVDAFDQQPILGERPRLVRQENGHRADGLGGTQPAEQDSLLRQAQPAERDEDRHEDRQLLGDRGERERQSVEQHLTWVLAPKDAEEGYEHARRHRYDQRCARQLGHRALKRGGRLLGLRHESAEAPDLSLVAQRDDDALAGAGHHGGARVQHGGALGERRVGVHPLGALGGGHRLARQPGLVGGQPVRVHDAGIGRDDAAGLDQQHVADDERARRDRHRQAGAPDERIGGAEVAESLQRALRTDLGGRLDGADEHDDRKDCDRVANLAEDRR